MASGEADAHSAKPAWPPPIGSNEGDRASTAPAGTKQRPIKWLYQEAQQHAALGARENAAQERKSADAQILQQRRKMQRDRKEQLAEMRPPSRDRPWAACLLDLDPDCKSSSSVGEAWAPQQDLDQRRGFGMEAGDSDSHSSKKGKRPVAKVEWFHRDMIRREVWRQKFEFLYRQCMAEAEDAREEGSRRPSSVGDVAASGPLPGTSPFNAGADQPSILSQSVDADKKTDTTTSLLEGLSPKQREKASQLSAFNEGRRGTPGGGSSSGDKRCGGQSRPRTPTQIPRPSVSMQSPTAASTPTNRSMQSHGGSHPQGSHWQVTGLREANRPRKNVKADAAPAATMTPSASGKGTLHISKPRSLQASASLPLLAAELHRVRDEYYDGDELFLHEDILYSSNPYLFPLRPAPGQGKPFPLPLLQRT